MMPTYDYQCIEVLLLRLLSFLLETFTDSERMEVQEFIDAGEYGLALETLADIVVDENKLIPSESLSLIVELVDVMQLDKKLFEERLRGRVTKGLVGVISTTDQPDQ
jgi:hypothetical protein